MAAFEGISEFPHHDRFALVLDDMARPSDFIAASQTEKHELVRGVYWLVLGCIHRRRLPLGCHARVVVKYFCLEGGKRWAVIHISTERASFNLWLS